MSNKVIQVCHIIHGIVGGGSEQVVLNYCSRMPDIHFDLLYQYEPNLQILERFNEAGINCIQIPDKIHHPLKHLCSIFRIFRQGKYDAVHSHLDWYMNSYVCFIAILAGIKKRIAHHHQAYHPNNLFLKLLCKLLQVPSKTFATHWLACSETAAINGWGLATVKKGKVIILPNAIDPDEFKFSEIARQEIRAQYGIKKDDFVIGHVGRFYPQKNHEFLIDVINAVHKFKPNAKLLLLGEGPLQDDVQKKVERLNLNESVIFAGLQKVPSLFYNAMDLFCLPSLWEGLGIVLLEAQYNGLPCIVSEFVPKEVQITQQMTFLPLSISCWEKIILQYQNSDRGKNSVIKNDKYNINHAVDALRKLYV